MFQNLPEEIERIIWKFYFTRNIVVNIKKVKSVWCRPSDELVSKCQEIGTIQHGHADLERVIQSTKSEYFDVLHTTCLDNLCLNCVHHGFPCLNAWYHGGFDTKLCSVWTMDFYKN